MTKVKSVKQIPFSGMVYNLEVEEDHSYVTDRTAVHNCCSIMDAMACGAIPVVNHRWAVGEHAELMQPWPSLVDGSTQDSELARHLWLNSLYEYLENPASNSVRRDMMDGARATYDWDHIIGGQIRQWLEADLA